MPITSKKRSLPNGGCLATTPVPRVFPLGRTAGPVLPVANETGSGQTGAKPDDDGAKVTRPSADQAGGEAVPYAAEPGEEESGEQAPEAAEEDKQPRDSAFKASGEPLRERLDPVGAEISQQPPDGGKEPFEPTIRDKDAPWTDGVDTLDDLPPGDKLAGSDEDKRSKLDSFRAKVYENYSDANDEISEYTKSVADFFGPRPTGHAETRADSGLLVVDAQHSSIDAGSAASAVLAAGVAAAELVRWGREKIRKRESE